MIHNTQNGEDDNTQSPPYKSHKDASNDLEKNDIEIGATQDEVTGKPEVVNFLASELEKILFTRSAKKFSILSIVCYRKPRRANSHIASKDS
ncbi:hypothetical protein RCL_jg10010.t1 [Rhizophagus clarus]|uniref:Uncharacterized protein n=1 Tax=Rhizophagus clarus TaxID=94130 RepID=A0A8H3QC84_9GLOM|nr:hypothetical protein RCL_jg10010.t1 [Rhizophagus clarus]